MWKADVREMNYYRIQASRDGTVLNCLTRRSPTSQQTDLWLEAYPLSTQGRVPETDAGGGAVWNPHRLPPAPAADRRDADDHQRPDGGGVERASAELG